MKRFLYRIGAFCAGVGSSLTPKLTFAAEIPFNPFEWAGSLLIISLAVVSVGLIAEASSEVLDAGLKAVGYEKKMSPADMARRDEAIKQAGTRVEAAQSKVGVPAVATTSALEQLQAAQAAQASKEEGEGLEPIDPKG
jgi:hypothetical protein